METAGIALNATDVVEDLISSYDSSILKLLLQDKTSKKNIIWATAAYQSEGDGYEENDEILPDLITGSHTYLIQPRSAKAKEIQEERTREKAEVFTPSWVCNQQNNLLDTQWFGHENVFNVEGDKCWTATKEKILFPSQKKTWKKYVDARRLEVTCGEAPYLVSRYDTVSGNMIPLNERIGLFDRKMRIVSENAENQEEWIEWSIRAVESVYGYEYQGDNLLLARENLLLSYIDYFMAYMGDEPSHKLLKKIANIIAWNIWQMDGLRFVIPLTCHDEEVPQGNLFGNPDIEPCPGCKSGNPHRHNGTYCKIQDWRSKLSVQFIDLMKGEKS